MKLTKDNVLEKWGDAKLILQDKKEFIDLAEDSFIPFANLYDEFDEDMKKDFDSFLDTANKLLEEKENKREEAKPKFKVGDWVISKIHTPEGVKESLPLLITEVMVMPDGKVAYNFDGGEIDVFEDEIIRKTTDPNKKKEEKKKISAREIRTYSDLVKNVKDPQKISDRASKDAKKEGFEVNYKKLHDFLKRYYKAVENDDFGEMFYIFCYLEECNFHTENKLLLEQNWTEFGKLIQEMYGNQGKQKSEPKPKYEKNDWVVIKVRDQNPSGKYQEGIPGWVDAIGLENGKIYYKVKITGGKDVFVEDSEIFGKSNEVPNFFIGQVAYMKPASDEVGLIPIKIKSVYCDREGKTFVYRDEKSDTIWSENQLTHYAPKAEKPKKEPKAKEEKPKKESKKKEKPTSNATPVEALSPEVKLIKRVITLQGKTMKKANSEKTNNPRAILNAIQRAIRTKQIRKTSKYADEVMYAQDALIRIVNGALSGALSGSDVINFTRYDDLVKVANSEVVSETAKIASQFIKIQEKEGKQKEAENLLKRIDKSGEKGEEIDGMKKALKNYVDGKTTKLKASEQVLKGLHGIVDVNFESGDVVNSTTIEGKHFDTLDFHGRWEGFFGKPNPDFKFMFYGKPGNGKSTFALQFAGYLSRELGLPVLYVANEEGFGLTLQEKVKRLGVANSNLYLCDSLPEDLSQFSVVFLDSVNNMGLEPEDLKALPSGKAYVYVFQTTKDGNYMGKQEFAHDVDTVVRVENMNAYKYKNRYGGEIQEFKVG